MALTLNFSNAANKVLGNGETLPVIRVRVKAFKKVPFLALYGLKRTTYKFASMSSDNVSTDGKKSRAKLTTNALVAIEQAKADFGAKNKDLSAITLVEGQKFLVETVAKVTFVRLVPVADDVDTFGLPVVTVTGSVDEDQAADVAMVLLNGPAVEVEADETTEDTVTEIVADAEAGVVTVEVPVEAVEDAA